MVLWCFIWPFVFTSQKIWELRMIFCITSPMPNFMKVLFTSISHSPWVRPTVIVHFPSTSKGQGSSQSPQDYYLSEVPRLHKSRHITHQFRLPVWWYSFYFCCQSSDRFRWWLYVFLGNLFLQYFVPLGISYMYISSYGHVSNCDLARSATRRTWLFVWFGLIWYSGR